MMNNGVDLHSIAFAPGQVEITYAEKHDNDVPDILLVKTLVCPASMVEEQLGDALDSVRELLDAALSARRAPRLMG